MNANIWNEVYTASLANLGIHLYESVPSKELSHRDSLWLYVGQQQHQHQQQQQQQRQWRTKLQLRQRLQSQCVLAITICWTIVVLQMNDDKRYY